ncbi:protein RecA [Vibrio phage VH2_2019]|nr:protein RecA [Vibrio phage VH2_2019]
MASAAEVMKTVSKKIKGTSAKLASDYENCERIPTGIFELDYAMGGGFPRGKISIVYGQESSNKTNVCLRTARSDMKLGKDRMWVFMDIENHFDPVWAKRLGINLEQLIVVKPDYAEQAVDLAEAFLMADDIHGIIIDSLAMLTPEAEASSTADRTQVGGNAKVVTALMRKMTRCLLMCLENDRYPTVLCINQVRQKIGVMFGDPETQAGGNAVRFQSGLTLRLYGKDKIPKGMKIPYLKETKCVIRKAKVPILNKNPEFDFVVLPYDIYQIGESTEWTFLLAQLKDLGWMVQEGKKWKFDGEEFAKQDDVKPYIYEDLAYLEQVKVSIIKTRMIDLHGEDAWIDYEVPKA